MRSGFIAFIALGLACVLAAGGGAYLAVRQAQRVSHPAAATAQPAATVQQPAVPDNAVALPAPAAPPEASSSSWTPSAPVQESAESAPSHNAHRSAPKTSRREVKEPAADADAGQPAMAQNASDTGHANAPTQKDPSSLGNEPPAAISQAPPEPQHEWVDVTVPSETVLGLQIQTAVSSETARVEDRVEARVTRDVRVGDRVAIPSGSQALGTVVQVERGGKVKDRAHFAIRFTTLLLPDGTRLPLTAEAVHREGPSPANKSAARIGGATVGGAILGAILGGGKGAAIGGAIGAGGGTAATMASDREPATLPAGSIVNVRLMSPVTVTLER